MLIDLKVGDLTHQDLGQIQMYVHYFEEEMMNEGVIHQLKLYYVQIKVIQFILNYYN